jgi:outer membrane protein TolC
MSVERVLLVCCLVSLPAQVVHAQVELPPPEGLLEHVVDGKLRLSDADVVRLTLLNDASVKISLLRHQESEYGVQRAQQAFDPLLSSTLSSTRSTSPTVSQLQGAPTLSDLTQLGRLGYSQTLATGMRYDMTFSASRNRTNSVFATFNPSFASNLNLALTQPLLRNFGTFPNRAPVLIARSALRQSRANLEAQLSDSVAGAVNEYWDVVQARESLRVLRKSLELADASYQQDKRALELGALPPLDIFRSEQQVAARRLQVIQAEYALKRLEDRLRRTIGADIDPAVQALELELTETPALSGEPVLLDEEETLRKAAARRPELEAARQRLAIDDTNIRLARNDLRPDLSLTGFYAYGGRSGSQLDPATTPPAILSRGGLGDAVEQIWSRDFPTYGVTLQLRVPVRNRRAAADLASAQVARRQSLYALRQQQQNAALEARSAVRELEQSKASMAAARLSRDLGQKNLEAEQRKYELGVQTIFFVLEAQAELAQAELSLVQAEIGYRRALTAALRATGELLARHNVEIR